MQSFGFNQFGPPSVFKEIVQAPPVLSPIRVLVDVIGFGLNPYDAALRRGEQQANRPLPFPIVPGTDVVGTINSIGSDVTDYLPGDLVIAHPNIGGYASQVPVSHNKIGRLPSAFPIEQAVGLPSVGITAYNILFNALSIRPAQSLAIEGAAGGVGSLLLQLAKAAGLSVTAVAASKHANLLDQLGANQFIPSEKFSTANVKFDIVINAINGGNDQERGVAHVKASGQYLSLNPIAEALKQAHPQITMTAFQPKREYRDRPALGYLTKLMQQKELVVPIAQQFDFNLTSVIVAQSLLEQRHSAGKLIVLKNK